MYDFNYHRPSSLDDAGKILAGNEEAKLLAGGMTLLPTMKMRLASPSDLVDLSGIDGLADITDSGGAIEIGAMARHADVAHSDTVRAAIPALADLAESIGDAMFILNNIAGAVPFIGWENAASAGNLVVAMNNSELILSIYFIGLLFVIDYFLKDRGIEHLSSKMKTAHRWFFSWFLLINLLMLSPSSTGAFIYFQF